MWCENDFFLYESVFVFNLKVNSELCIYSLINFSFNNEACIALYYTITVLS